MGSFKSTILTQKAHALMAKLTAGTATSLFTKVRASEHDYSILTSSQLEALTTIEDIKQEVAVSEVERINDASVKVTATLVNTTLSTGYYIRTVALYANDPDEGEILYSVTVAIEADWMPPYNNISSASALYELVTTVSNSYNVSIDVDPNATVSITTFNKFKESVNEQMSNMEQQKANLVHKLTYKAVSNSIQQTTGYDDFHTDTVYEHLEYQGANMSLVMMVNITSATDPNPVMMDDSKIISCINKGLAHNVKTIMLKPHLGVNWSDGFNRKDYAPSDYATFFSNWKTILLHYAQMCNTYNIPILCLGCEQEQNTITTYASYWKDIYDSIKAVYPNLLLTYASNQVEWMRDESGIFENVDLIGFNVYLQWSTTPYTDDMTWEDVASAFYNSYDVIKDGIQMFNRVNFLANKYGKKIFITETGLVPMPYGLITLLPSGYNDSTQYNYYVSAIFLEALFNILKSTDNIVGLAIWHACGMFAYWTTDTSKPGYNVAENIVKKYYGEVL